MVAFPRLDGHVDIVKYVGNSTAPPIPSIQDARPQGASLPKYNKLMCRMPLFEGVLVQLINDFDFKVAGMHTVNDNIKKKP